MPPSSAAPLVPLAHKHAHHLHTIPPRQKSTRTLILDHMLWLHARTRFSQARAELGLPDLDTDDDQAFWVNSENGDGHPVRQSRRDALMAGLRYGPAHAVMEEVAVEEMSRADHVQARALRQKADGLEKVLTAIMDQCSESPPSQSRHSLDLDRLVPSSTSPRNDSRVQSGHSCLPNGVRVRLGVGALINTLFSRVDDSPPMDLTTPITRENSNANVSFIPTSLLPLCLSVAESAKADAQLLADGQTHPLLTSLDIFVSNTFSQPFDVSGMLF
jgi:hypothetical protein